MVGLVTHVPPVFTPPPHDGGCAVAPVAGGCGGGASHDPAAGRRVPDAASPERTTAPDPIAPPRGPFGTSWSSIADRLIDTGSSAESLAGPKAESPMVTESHRSAGRRAMILAALAEGLADRPMDAYAVDRPPGRAPEVVHPDPPVRIGTILDIVA